MRALFRARVLTPAERDPLVPTIALLCQRGLGPPLLRLWLWRGVRTVSAGGVGRRSVLVSAELMSQVRLGQLPSDQAAVIAHAAGLARVGDDTTRTNGNRDGRGARVRRRHHQRSNDYP